MTCPNCRKENREGAKFCSECGENLEIIGTAAHGLLGMVLTGTGHLSSGVERLEDVRKTFFEKNRRCLYAASENTLGNGVPVLDRKRGKIRWTGY